MCCLIWVQTNKSTWRAAEVETLLGDPSKAQEKLGWKPRITLGALVKEMVVLHDGAARKDALVKTAGFKAFDHHE